MKSPLWILNSILLVLFTLTLILMFFMRVKLPARTPMTPQQTMRSTKTVSINSARIYESDIFGTYVRPALPEPNVPQKPVITIPQPPRPKPLVQERQSAPEFLPPLDVELKGVIFNSNSAHSRIIVVNRKSKAESLHKIGELIEDAHLIYIGKNKAIFIRSNGQQEVIFISEEDAKKDPLYREEKWDLSVEKIDDNNYLIHVEPFKKQVQTLANFLTILDITTGFEKGVSVGCHVGRLRDALGASIGLQQSDVITSINGIPTNTTQNRVDIYKALQALPNNSVVIVDLKRNEQEHTIHYTLRKKMQKKLTTRSITNLPVGTKIDTTSVEKQEIVQKKEMEITEQTLAQAKSHQKIADIAKKNDKKAMLDYGGRNAVLRR